MGDKYTTSTSDSLMLSNAKYINQLDKLFKVIMKAKAYT